MAAIFFGAKIVTNEQEISSLPAPQLVIPFLSFVKKSFNCDKFTTSLSSREKARKYKWFYPNRQVFGAKFRLSQHKLLFITFASVKFFANILIALIVCTMTSALAPDSGRDTSPVYKIDGTYAEVSVGNMVPSTPYVKKSSRQNLSGRWFSLPEDYISGK